MPHTCRAIPLLLLVLVMAATSGCGSRPHYGESWVRDVTAEPGECPENDDG